MPIVKLMPAVQELDARIRGRLIYRTMMQLEHEPFGSFVFAGWIVSYVYCDGVLEIGMQEGP